MLRVVIPPQAVQGASIRIDDPKTLHHLGRVLRVSVGDSIQCVDGQGHRYVGTVTQCARTQWTVAITQQLDEPPPTLNLTLAQALIKPDRFEWVVEKATELGVSHLVPLLTSRTTIRPSSGVSASRLARWRRIAEGASAQCGRATLPTISEPKPLANIVSQWDSHATILPTLAVPGTSLVQALQEMKGVQQLIIVIGPEGDFSSEEVALAIRHGARPVSLGSLVLRSETAAVAVLATAQQLLGTP